MENDLKKLLELQNDLLKAQYNQIMKLEVLVNVFVFLFVIYFITQIATKLL